MAHLPFNHVYRPWRWGYGRRPQGNYPFPNFYDVTLLTLLCGCGKQKCITIAKTKLTSDELDDYLSRVYPER